MIFNRIKEIRRLNLWSITEQFKRYSGTFLKYLTPIKLFNALRNLYEMKKRCDHLKSKPYALKIEPTNICNLNCIGCSTGRGDNPVSKGKMPFELFRQIIDEIGKYIFVARMDGQGEPLFNRDIFKMIEYAHMKNIGTVMSTNFILFSNKDIERVVKSGLDILIISMDGITQKTYQRYRKSGDLKKVMDNISNLISIKEQLGAKHPYVELQFLVFDHNRHEIPMARKYAMDVGVNRFAVIGEKRSIKPHKLDKCYWLWGVLTVGWNGDCKPCCFAFDNLISYGNINNENFQPIWNNKNYQNARVTLFKPKKSCSEMIISCPFKPKTH